MTSKTCTIPSCGRPHKGRGLCNMHLMRLRKTGKTDSPVRSQEERFWEKVDKRGPDDCWLWTKATNDAGYGVLRPAGQRTGPAIRAHRYSAELAGMDIVGRQVLHSCDNPPCVNPAHLRPGTNAENSEDAVGRGRIPLGSQRPNSRLTEQEVADIKTMLANGTMHKDIAAQYGVNRATITMINTGKSWRHVQPNAVCPPNARDLGMIAAESLN